MKNRNFRDIPRSLRRRIACFSILIAGCLAFFPDETHAQVPTIYETSFAITGSPLDSNASSFYSVNAVTGAPTLIGNIGFSSVSGIDFDSSGTLYGVGQAINNGNNVDRTAVLITINPTTGVGTQVAPITFSTGGALNQPIQDISFRNSDGMLFAYSNGDLLTINKTTGVATLVGNNGLAAPPAGGATAFSPSDKLLTVSQTLVLTTNQATGQLATGPTFAQYAQSNAPGSSYAYATGMDFDNTTGKLWATVTIDPTDQLHGVNYLANIDPITGVVTQVGALEGDMGFQGLAVAPAVAAVVPEPGSALVGLLTLGICFCGAFARNRRETVAS